MSNHAQALPIVRKARQAGAATAFEAERLRLLEAEILIFDQKEADGLALLEPPLDPAATGALTPRREMLLGAALRRKQRWPEAQERLGAAIEGANAIGDRRTEVMARVQMASGLASRRQWDEASAQLTSASALAPALGNAYLTDIVRFNQGSLLMRRGEPDRSTEIYRVVAEDAERRHDTLTLARSLDNMAINYQAVGDYERALEYNGKALEAIDKLDLPDSQMQSHGERGLLLLELHRSEEAIADLQRAVEIARKRRNADSIRRWSNNLTEALLAAGRVDEAERLNREVVQGDPAWPYSLANQASIHERRGRPADSRRVWDTVLADKDCPEAIRWGALYGLARLHAAAGERALAEDRYREVLELIDQEWTSLRTDDSRLTFLTRAEPIYRSYVSALVRWGEDREALRVEESSRARLLGGGVVSLDSLQQLAGRTRSVFLSYWIAPEGGSHVRVIGAGRGELVPLPGVEPREVERLVREHNDLVERQLGDPREAGKAGARLYELLIAPAMARIPAAARLVIIPDGALHALNFETLVREKDGRKGFWIEDVTLQVAPSLSLLKEQTGGPQAGRRHLLLMGDALPAPDFGRLDHAAAEMKLVRDTFGDRAVTELAGEAARPSAYAASSPGAHTHIHFTAHAKADRESPLDSAVILTPEPTGGSEPRYRLLAREVAGVPLRADMVTVSACRSAGDRMILGEGMVGFAWAFLRAGASNVVAGLWDVNDRSTAKLMAAMYAGVRAGKPAAEALRAAKLAFIAGGKNYAKPYYWAPFQVYTRSLSSK